MNLACGGREPEAGSHLMPSGVPAGARVHVDKVEIKVPHDFQDVGMTANEEVGPALLKDGLGGPVVIPRAEPVPAGNAEQFRVLTQQRRHGLIGACHTPIGVRVAAAFLSRSSAVMRLGLCSIRELQQGKRGALALPVHPRPHCGSSP